MVQVSGGLHFLSVCFVFVTGSSGVQGPQRRKPHQHHDCQAGCRPQWTGECGVLNANRIQYRSTVWLTSVQVSLVWPFSLSVWKDTACLVSLKSQERSPWKTNDTIVRPLATCEWEVAKEAGCVLLCHSSWLLNSYNSVPVFANLCIIHICCLLWLLFIIAIRSVGVKIVILLQLHR